MSVSVLTIVQVIIDSRNSILQLALNKIQVPAVTNNTTLDNNNSKLLDKLKTQHFTGFSIVFALNFGCMMWLVTYKSMFLSGMWLLEGWHLTTHMSACSLDNLTTYIILTVSFLLPRTAPWLLSSFLLASLDKSHPCWSSLVQQKAPTNTDEVSKWVGCGDDSQ